MKFIKSSQVILLMVIFSGCASVPDEILLQEQTLAEKPKQPQTTLSAAETAANCSGLQDPSKDESLSKDFDLGLYQLYINDKGHLIDLTNGSEVVDPSNGNLAESPYIQKVMGHYQAKLEQLNDLKKTGKIDNRATLRPVIFIHGGLNNYGATEQRTRQLTNNLLKDCQYPIFFSWDSAALSNYIDHLFFLRRGSQSDIFGPLSFPFVLMEDVLRSIARIPASTYYELVKEDIYFKNYTDPSYANTRQQDMGNKYKPLPQSNEKDTPQPVTDDINLLENISMLNPIKLLTAPFIDGLGAGAWDSMLRRTDFVLKRDINGRIRPNKTAISNFLREFTDKYKNTNMLLVGHSMGTIIANLVLADNPDLKFSNIVYMAAACRVKDVEDVVAPYLAHHPDVRFWGLSLNTRRDILENEGHDFIPRGSLLVWLDNTLAEVNSSMDRTAGYYPKILAHADVIFPENVQKNVRLVEFGVDDNSPQNHGDFGHFPFWRSSFWEGCFYNDRCHTGNWELRDNDWLL